MEELLAVQVIENVGFEGCAHARPRGKRQLLLVGIETLRAFELAPGIVRENITTEGLEVNRLAIGQRLQVGEAQLELTTVCEPCELMEDIRAGLRTELVGRRGMLCRVLRGGTVKQGDQIQVLRKRTEVATPTT
jgi:MOSC domain-containing protein YiiM